MEYKLFKKVVTERFLEFLPEEYKDAEIIIRPIEKVNETLDGLSVIPSQKGTAISPALYINGMYEYYLETKDLNDTLAKSAESFMKAVEGTDNIDIKLSSLMDANAVKDKIVFQLINTAQNKQMIENMPHRSFCDLTLIYRIVVKLDEDGLASIPIRKDLEKELGISEEQMFRLAKKNTRRLMPPVIKPMSEVVKEMLMLNGMPEEVANVMVAELPSQQMYVVNNNKKINGATNIVYETVLHELAEQLETDLYIILSSIHEFIVAGTDMGDPDLLAQMVAVFNMDVDLKDRLSNQVYFYDRMLRKVTNITDTPNKRVDGILA